MNYEIMIALLATIGGCIGAILTFVALCFVGGYLCNVQYILYKILGVLIIVFEIAFLIPSMYLYGILIADCLLEFCQLRM